MDRASNLAVADRIMAAFFSGDSDVIQALVDPDFVLEPPREALHYGVYRGGDGFLEFMATFTAAYDLQSADRAGVYASEDGAVLVFELKLRGVVRSSGNGFDTSLMEAWHFDDGRLVLIRPHWFELPR